MNQLRHLKDCVSPLSWLYGHLAIVMPFVMVMRPTLREVLIALVVDWLAFAVTRPIEARVFQRVYPDTAVYFDGLDEERIARMDSSQRVALVRSFMSFPARRAWYVVTGSWIKVIPACLVILFVWKYEGPLWLQLLKFTGIECLVFAFFYGAVYIESHIFLSDKLAKLHEKFDFSAAFQEIEIPYCKREYERTEILTFVMLVVFMLSLQLTVELSSAMDTGHSEMAAKVLLVGVGGMMLFFRIWQLNRNFLAGGLQRIFGQMRALDLHKNNPMLPLHTWHFLAQFEKTYNLLLSRVRRSERELSSFVIEESDRTRYRNLGEISGLIAHDILGPLNAALFYISELHEGAQDPKTRDYLERTNRNLERILELASSIRSRLKTPAIGGQRTEFTEAHQQVLRILELQFRPHEFEKVRFVVDTTLESIAVAVSRPDLIHALDNIYRNAMQNLLEHEVPESVIAVELLARNAESVCIQIRDNGTGLTREAFERHTGFRAVDASEPEVQVCEGLGLRLMRRLIELRGGTLEVAAESRPGNTLIRLTLPLAQ